MAGWGLCIAVEGYVCVCRAMYSCVWLCIAVKGYICVCMPMYSCGRLCIAV